MTLKKSDKNENTQEVDFFLEFGIWSWVKNCDHARAWEYFTLQDHILRSC